MAATRRKTNGLTHNEHTPQPVKGRRETIPLPRLLPKGKGAYDTVEWEYRDAVIKNPAGKIIFEAKGVKVPKDWGDASLNIAASKYFRLVNGKRENSIEAMVRRVTHWIAFQGLRLGYFDTDEEAAILEENLAWLILHQAASHNSPVWFNVGVREPPQCSACFIQSISDSMDSILNLEKSEAMLFKGGSGTGTNFSPLRSSVERLAGGGIASGPVSFMRAFDAMAGVIKSGGTTRRAAKMVVLNVDHPDIEEFIQSKVKEEDKAYALIREGYSANFDGTDPDNAYASIAYQNANHSVRVSDAFMESVQRDGAWATHFVVEPQKVAKVYKAKELFHQMAEAAWRCGDPGVQFDDTINDWHTCANSGRINASNPCSEYLFLDDTACNLASLNLMKFVNAEGQFDIEFFRKAVRTFIVSMEILVDASTYPTPTIAENSHVYRTLGLGYANVGSLLMARGLPYDSDDGRSLIAAITSLLSAEGYQTSADIAKRVGPFPGFDRNRNAMGRVMRKHLEHSRKISRTEPGAARIAEAATAAWERTVEAGESHGYRNAQISVIAPTGTIGLLMGCDTLGLEPDIGLVKVKNLVGGGIMKMVNTTVRQALRSLGYPAEDADKIVKHVESTGSMIGAPGLKPEHLPVFDTALPTASGPSRIISPMGHLKMLAAIQPFLSGGASKTINLPNDATVEDVANIYLESWKLGVKCVSIYRDGCKASQPYDTGASKDTLTGLTLRNKPKREKLPDYRNAITHHFSVGGHDGYVTVGLYPDGRPGEVFFRVTKEGSTVNGLMDALGISMSMALQHGVPLKDLVRKLAHMRFEPAGMTSNPKIRFAKSIPDYVARWMAQNFMTDEERRGLGLEDHDAPETTEKVSKPAPASTTVFKEKPLEAFEKEEVDRSEDAPSCPSCGGIMMRSGTCYACTQCGMTSGCS
jgi:ribonucleoside-diphosphate reductase alpha chain